MDMHEGLKIRRPQGHGGSIPPPGTIKSITYRNIFLEKNSHLEPGHTCGDILCNKLSPIESYLFRVGSDSSQIGSDRRWLRSGFEFMIQSSCKVDLAKKSSRPGRIK
jgi:hypothetical protein